MAEGRFGAGGRGAPQRPDRPRGDPPLAPMRVPAAELFRGRRELIILHNADEYRLRVTSNGKLSLTK
jgi:hemin uptake protein HemP